ncbi:SLATT domain-containing protein [Priestia aryabhattai]|uniref:SLATT domain-containing protein n=1 Tax=Priestia aryabhattai TaxID=412384 RepID=UPI003D270F18
MSDITKENIKELMVEVIKEEEKNNNFKEEIKSLKDKRVWATKKARMEAEARMNRNNLLSQLLVNYYTFGVLAFSIWTLVSEDSNMSLLTVVASVGLFGLSIFVSAISYREKALQYKESYLSLNELEFELKSLLRNKQVEENEIMSRLYDLEKRYTEILTKSENHSDIDYIKVLIKHNLKASSEDLIKYYIHKVGFYIFAVLLIVAPIILTAIYMRGLE